MVGRYSHEVINTLGPIHGRLSIVKASRNTNVFESYDSILGPRCRFQNLYIPIIMPLQASFNIGAYSSEPFSKVRAFSFEGNPKTQNILDMAYPSPLMVPYPFERSPLKEPRPRAIIPR